MNLGDLNKIWEIKALKRKPNEEEARKILERVAKQVQPIMRKHNWRVKVLSEFCPKNSALLGLNVGKGIHVKLRLRRPNRDDQFYPFNEILDTMLHELCHNVHGPHNANFYKLWDEIRKECEDLMNKGISGTGEGFDVPGRRLGGFLAKPPLSSLRQTALSAAEKRARLGLLLPSGPKRVGGDSSIKAALSPMQAAAMAAERRLQDNIWCGSESYDVSEENDSTDSLLKPSDTGLSFAKSSGHRGLDGQGMNVLSRKRSRESDNVSSSQLLDGHLESTFIDLTKVTSECGSSSCHDKMLDDNICSMDKSWMQSSESNNSVNLSKEASTPQSIYIQGLVPDKDSFKMWECTMCTLFNPICVM
ncbi:DNA-dependent metalloprotease WSS1 isoform X2 [Olea europaea var. sylvestris]|uniref:DNA-dependent metalloprotease WSS1 isoform X2 n=1 Tax=Olea europaea var. sylvestris TaxID=158386 RepID=UPI000C1D7C4F|nr:DNA-dependent metalloprotease WSS1 isoform X2 [Olea europaea var. sylvestris]